MEKFKRYAAPCILAVLESIALYNYIFHWHPVIRQSVMVVKSLVMLILIWWIIGMIYDKTTDEECSSGNCRKDCRDHK